MLDLQGRLVDINKFDSCINIYLGQWRGVRELEGIHFGERFMFCANTEKG